MRLRRLYSNRPLVFQPIRFRDGLNVVVGSVRRPKSRDRDTHNLGKSLLAQILDFCLIKKRKPAFFLFKHQQFAQYVFFLELELDSGSYVTVRRSVQEGSKASFAYHDEAELDLSAAGEGVWQHWNVPFERARELLDGALDLEAVAPWSYRNAISYALRTQQDYDDPFRLTKFAAKHSTWKPYLAHVLGLDATVVQRGYVIEAKIQQLKADEARAKGASGGVETADQLRGLVEMAERDVSTLGRELETFNLAPSEERVTRQLVDDLDQRIAQANEDRYIFESERVRINKALSQRLLVDLGSLETLFSQAKVYFGDQVKRDYQALLEFNRELLEERDSYLREELLEIVAQINELDQDLRTLNRQRSEALRALSDAAALDTYKSLTRRFANRQAELEVLRLRHKAVDELLAVRREVHRLELEAAEVHASLEQLVASTEGTYREIRRYFDEIVLTVVGRHGNLFTEVNKQGHPEFRTEIVEADGSSTSAGQGFSYGRLICIAFDMAVARAYSNRRYPHFIYHDGFLETLDDRKKLNLIDISREYSANGTQHIITVIDAELPVDENGNRFAFDESEVILRLHDADDSGRLFAIPSW